GVAVNNSGSLSGIGYARVGSVTPASPILTRSRKEGRTRGQKPGHKSAKPSVKPECCASSAAASLPPQEIPTTKIGALSPVASSEDRSSTNSAMSSTRRRKPGVSPRASLFAPDPRRSKKNTSYPAWLSALHEYSYQPAWL